MRPAPIVLSLALLLVFVSLSCLANDAAIRGIGGSVQAMDEHPTVVMESERVEIKMHPDKIDVTTTFVFRNTGGRTEVEMGFPERGHGDVRMPEFSSFRAFVDGKPVNVQTSDWDRQDNGWSRWRTKTVSFGPNQTRVVTNRYTSQAGEVTDGIRFINYILTTGQSWKDPIGKADIVIDTSGIKDHQTINPSPEGYVRSGMLIKWHFENFEPEQNIGLKYARGYSDFVVDNRPTRPYVLNLYSAPQAPRIEDGVMMVPAQILGQLLGGDVQYDNVADILVYRMSGTEVRIHVPGKKADVDGRSEELPHDTRMVSGRVMVPLAAVARLVGADVSYNSNDRKTYITRPRRSGI